MRRRDLLTLTAALPWAGDALAATPLAETPMTTCCPIVELRQYTMRQGQREAFIALFEQQFITSQEATGIQLLGMFRDLDDPNRVVWMRGFPDMPSRGKSLAEFYSCPTWMANRDAANACILDSDNVLLLHPRSADSGVRLERPAPHDGLLVAEIRYLDRAAARDFATFFAAHMQPRMAQAGARVLGVFETEQSPNNFRLPVRENVTVLASVLAFSGLAAHRAYLDALAKGPDWRDAAPDALLAQFAAKPEVLRLTPTPHSPLHG
jgi:quinol monooxygenase YgiN